MLGLEDSVGSMMVPGVQEESDTVLYFIPPIKNQAQQQKGPTCWYYAAQMVARFHGDWSTETQKLVSLMRKMSTFIGANKGAIQELDDQHFKMLLENPNSPAQKSVTTQVSQQKVMLNPRHAQYGFKALEPEYKWDLPLGSMMGPNTFNLIPQPKIMRQQDLPLPDMVQEALILLNGLKFDGIPDVLAALQERGIDWDLLSYYYKQIEQTLITQTRHINVKRCKYSLEQLAEVSTWFGNWRKARFQRSYLLQCIGFESVTKLDVFEVLQSAANLKAFLAVRGPIWCGGFFEFEKLSFNVALINKKGTEKMGITDNDRKIHMANLPLVDIRKATHAIAVCGVNTTLNHVYYRDPNFSKTLLCLPFDVFAPRILDYLKALPDPMLTYNCPHCMHLGSSLTTRLWPSK